MANEKDMRTPDPDILIIEDSPTLALTYKAYLKNLEQTAAIAATGEEGLAALRNDTPPKVVLLDLVLPDMNGLEILDIMRREGSNAKVIVMTAHGSVKTAVDAMRHGALDFIMKPFPADRLLDAVKNALELSEIHSIVVEESYRQNSDEAVGSFIGESSAMKQVYRMIRDAAPSRASVFIMGESGTGKELCATALHDLSPRKNAPMVALNCAAIPSNLIESEIFGHIKGAFTGATEDREGAAVRAHGGTLFLDEICEMPMELQAKLLRFIQTGQIVPVGSNRVQKVDVRFICATNRHPWEAVQAGDFREDLYYRLHVIPIMLPPLRERGKDVIRIADVLLTKYSNEEQRNFKGLSEDAQERLVLHSWPGNVRELGNVIQSAVVLHKGDELTADMLERILGPANAPRLPATARPMKLPDFLKNGMESMQEETSRTIFKKNTMHSADDPDLNIAITDQNGALLALKDIEKLIIKAAIEASGGRVRLAAKRLQVDPSTLYRKITEWKEKG